jgi:hypothetical protein
MERAFILRRENCFHSVSDGFDRLSRLEDVKKLFKDCTRAKTRVIAIATVFVADFKAEMNLTTTIGSWSAPTNVCSS